MKPRPRWPALLCAVLCLATAAACSLPVSQDVHAVGEAVGEKPTPGPLVVIPPGPKLNATLFDTVLGFLGAQASSEGRHAVARQFLADDERARWQDEAQVLVYDPDQVELANLHSDQAGRAVVRVTSVVSGQVRPDGSFVVRPGVRVSEDYGLVRVQGQWRLDSVPAGLRLSSADLQRAYAPRAIYYVAPTVGVATRRLVPDRVFLPVEQDLAASLVNRLLRAPTTTLAGAASTAVPVGTRVEHVRQDSSGVVTVDLAGAATRPSGRLAQDLSAQLCWTLRALGPGFRGLRLRLDGRPLDVPGESDVQDPADWSAYDPDVLGAHPPYYYVDNGRLRSSVRPPSGPAATGAVPLDLVAVSPDLSRLATVEERADGQSVVRVGALNGSSLPVAARGRLSSPTWGAGDRGLWLVRGERDVVLLGSSLRRVPVVGLPAGRVTALAVSRDGVRLALVVGGRLYVGRVVTSAGEPRVIGLGLVLPTLHDVRAVSWGTGTDLVVLGSLARLVQVVRVAVDGSTVQTLNTAGLEPAGVTASPTGVVLVAAGRLYESSGGAFRQVPGTRVTAPAFPG